MTTDRDKTIELVISNLALTVQEALLRIEAYRKVIAQGAPQLTFKVAEAESDLQDSPIQKQCAALRTQAVQAARDSDTTAFVQSVGDMRGVIRRQLDYAPVAGFQTEGKP
jgi:hypothetical protein